MAAANAQFAKPLRPALQHAKSDCLAQTSRRNGIKKVNDFFSELEDTVKVLEEKYNKQSTFGNV